MELQNQSIQFNRNETEPYFNEMFEELDFIKTQFIKDEKSIKIQEFDDQIFEEFMKTSEDDFMI